MTIALGIVAWLQAAAIVALVWRLRRVRAYIVRVAGERCDHDAWERIEAPEARWCRRCGAVCAGKEFERPFGTRLVSQDLNW